MAGSIESTRSVMAGERSSTDSCTQTHKQRETLLGPTLAATAEPEPRERDALQLGSIQVSCTGQIIPRNIDSPQEVRDGWMVQ